MAFKRHTPGCRCCLDNIDTFNITDARYRKTPSAKTAVWSGGYFGAGTVAGGSLRSVALAPSFAGGGVVTISDGGGGSGGGLWAIDIDTGEITTQLVVDHNIIGSGNGAVFNECAGRVTYFRYGGVFSDLVSVNSAGATTVTSLTAGIDRGPTLRLAGGNIWRAKEAADKKLWNHDYTTARADLTSVMVDSDAIRNLVSEDGSEIYAIGLSTDETKVELFRVQTSGAAALVASHTITSPPSGFLASDMLTQYLGYVYWGVFGDSTDAGEVWRYDPIRDEATRIIQKNSGVGWKGSIANGTGKGCIIKESA